MIGRATVVGLAVVAVALSSCTAAAEPEPDDTAGAAASASLDKPSEATEPAAPADGSESVTPETFLEVARGHVDWLENVPDDELIGIGEGICQIHRDAIAGQDPYRMALDAMGGAEVFDTRQAMEVQTTAIAAFCPEVES